MIWHPELKIMGRRRTDVIPFDQPCELGYHCPVCVYELEVDGNFDERLTWSEFNFFMWCYVCGKDYPSALCCSDVDKGVQIFLDSMLQFRAL